MTTLRQLPKVMSGKSYHHVAWTAKGKYGFAMHPPAYQYDKAGNSHPTFESYTPVVKEMA